MVPRNLPGFPHARRVKPMTGFAGGRRPRWRDANDDILEWDARHGRVERYDARGRHLGEFDPETGERAWGTIEPARSWTYGAAMNVLLKIQQSPPAVAEVAHSIMAYEHATEELALELPIPLFLDTLALKIARVPPEDKYGALSYPLEARAVDTVRFLLGLDVDMSRREYFLESTIGHQTSFGRRKLKAVELLTQVTPRPRYARMAKPRISPSASWSCRRCACLTPATRGGWPRAT